MSRPENKDHLKIREFLGDSRPNFSAKKRNDTWQYRVIEEIAFTYGWSIEETILKIRGYKRDVAKEMSKIN